MAEGARPSSVVAPGPATAAASGAGLASRRSSISLAPRRSSRANSATPTEGDDGDDSAVANGAAAVGGGGARYRGRQSLLPAAAPALAPETRRGSTLITAAAVAPAHAGEEEVWRPRGAAVHKTAVTAGRWAEQWPLGAWLAVALGYIALLIVWGWLGARTV